jgi:hypothetical protein
LPDPETGLPQTKQIKKALEVIDRQPLAEEQSEQKQYLKVHLLIQALCCLQMDTSIIVGPAFVC